MRVRRKKEDYGPNPKDISDIVIPEVIKFRYIGEIFVFAMGFGDSDNVNSLRCYLWYHMTSYQIIWYHMVSYEITWYHTISFFFTFWVPWKYILKLLLFEVISKTTEPTIFFLSILSEYNRLILILIIQKFQV